ncbi:MAG: zinc-binding alcohol dehydrogenase [Abditibacteriales bacterium]|nr:zinc-binding alcohol dehydrogenase [Abditibacteriales bacterium]MDW8366958.1 zinc-binding alcohol dehydrogenase [Abditibacteriales bacterium]
MTGHRVVWTQRGVAEIETFAVPSPQEGQLLLRTRVTLISPGTERAFFLGLPNTSQKYPQHAGYSNVGEVMAVGAKAEGFQVGDRVACAASHSSHVVVRAANCLPVPEDAPDEEAVFFNLAAIAMQGVRKARVELGESVVVVGSGLIGLLAMQLAKLNGALPVIAVDKDEGRLSFARQAGADATVLADDNVLSAVRHLAEADGAAVVIEATGHPEAIPQAFALAGTFGRVILLGSTRGETERVNFYRDVHKKGLTIIGAHAAMRPRVESSAGWWTTQADQRVALKLLALKRLTVQPLITHRFPWQDAPHAYALLKAWDLRALGMVLNWSNSPVS